MQSHFFIKLTSIIYFVTAVSFNTHAQSFQNQIEILTSKIEVLDEERKQLQTQLINTKQDLILENLNAIGLPSDNFISHKAMILEYSEEHEQPKWVAHMIIPDIEKGNENRSNDFRIDPMVTTGTAIQEDYFLSDTLSDGTVVYDAFGYDRGHLAPSSDFRWTADALSESFYYSNMSPQVAEFNREIWLEIEVAMREYVITNKVPLYIITAPILNENLPKIDRSINQISIPQYFIKAAYDKVNNTAIAFYIENKAHKTSISTFAKTIKEVEELSGLNLFKNVDSKVKTGYVASKWFRNSEGNTFKPIDATSLPKGHFNTKQAQNRIMKTSIVCGKVEYTKYSGSGNLWLSLDGKYPNQAFSIYVKKDDLVNFPPASELKYMGKNVCAEGKIFNLNDVPTINATDEGNLWLYLDKN
jgi:endonuclease G